jgi:hypothetical protein
VVVDVVLLRHRIAEQRHQPVAELLGDFAAHFHDRRGGHIEISANPTVRPRVPVWSLSVVPAKSGIRPDIYLPALFMG